MVTVDFLQITKSEQVFESGGHPSTYRPRPPAPHRQEYRTPPGMKASFESFQIFLVKLPIMISRHICKEGSKLHILCARLIVWAHFIFLNNLFYD